MYTTVIITGSKIKKDNTLIDYRGNSDIQIYERVPTKLNLMGYCNERIIYIIKGNISNECLKVIQSNTCGIQDKIYYNDKNISIT